MSRVDDRARELASRLSNERVGHPTARNFSQRDRAHLVQFFRNYPDRDIPLSAIMGRPLESDLIQTYGLQNTKSLRQDDLTVMSKRLPELEFLEHLDDSHRFRLTAAGIEAAQREIASAEAL